MYKRYIFLIIIAMCGIVSAAYTAYVNVNEEPYKASEIVKQQPIKQPTNRFSDKDIDKLVDWAYKNAKTYIPKRDIRQIVEETTKYDMCLLLLAVAKEESHFDRYARSNKNALGLCQIMSSVWLETLKKEGIVEKKIDFFDYTKNIAAANYILSGYYNKEKSWKKALNKYVSGSSKYVINVLSSYAELKLILNDI